MYRRRYLATAATAAALATAGCSSLGGTVSLGDPEVVTQDGGKEKFLRYSHDGENVLTVGFDQRTSITSPEDRFGLRLSVSHSDATTIESFRFDLRAPQSSVDPPAEIYLRAPGTTWPDLTFETVEGRWTRIAVDDVGELGESTVLLETIVAPIGTPATEVGVRVGTELTGGGRTYELDTATEFEPVTG